MALKSSSYNPFDPRLASGATPTALDADRAGMVFRDANVPSGVEPTEVRQLAPETSWRAAGRWEPTSEKPTKMPKVPELARKGEPSAQTPRKRATAKAQRKRKQPLPTVAAGRPDLAAEWHPTRNGDLRPYDVTLGARRKVVWKCATCGHEWEARVNSRSSGTGCPHCSRFSRDVIRRTAVVCVETGEVFVSIRSAAERGKLRPGECISLCLDNPNATAGGCHWRRLDRGISR